MRPRATDFPPSVKLRDAMPMMGDRSMADRVRIRAGEDCPDVVTDVWTALAAYGDRVVAEAKSAGAPDGRPDATLYTLVPDHGTPYLRNPDPIPAGVKCWRTGDSAWTILPNGQPEQCAVTGIESLSAIRTETTLRTVPANAGPDAKETVVPAWALFRSRHEAIAAKEDNEKSLTDLF